MRTTLPKSLLLIGSATALLSSAAPAAVISDFTISDWSAWYYAGPIAQTYQSIPIHLDPPETTSPPAGFTNGEIFLSVLPTPPGGSKAGAVTLYGPNNVVDGSWVELRTTIPAGGGTVSFDWNYYPDSSNSAAQDPSYYRVNTFVDTESRRLAVASTGGNEGPQSGSKTIPVNGGDEFAFIQATSDGLFGVGTLVISNFSFDTSPAPEPIPEPGSLLTGFIILGALARRRRPVRA